MKITAYLKPHCGWSNGVRAILAKYNLEYEEKDIINYPHIYAEMVQKSGHNLSPCVEVDGIMLADVSGEEVEQYMLSNKLVQPTDRKAETPTDQGCSHEDHDETQSQSIHFP